MPVKMHLNKNKTCDCGNSWFCHMIAASKLVLMNLLQTLAFIVVYSKYLHNSIPVCTTWFVDPLLLQVYSNMFRVSLPTAAASGMFRVSLPTAAASVFSPTNLWIPSVAQYVTLACLFHWRWSRLVHWQFYLGQHITTQERFNQAHMTTLWGKNRQNAL
jgi:hypothetical protein